MASEKVPIDIANSPDASEIIPRAMDSLPDASLRLPIEMASAPLAKAPLSIAPEIPPPPIATERSPVARAEFPGSEPPPTAVA